LGVPPLDAVQRSFAGRGVLAGLRHAIERQHATPDLPYGIEVWRGGPKVLSVLWADDGSFEVASFVRGEWEEEALAL